MQHLDRISIDPEIRFGKPCVRGTRITVGEVLGYLAAGGVEPELLNDFPQLTHEDLLACFGFAAERERRLLALPAAQWPFDCCSMKIFPSGCCNRSPNCFPDRNTFETSRTQALRIDCSGISHGPADSF